MSALPDVIGLSGYAGVGKDVLARLLASQHGYRIAHFADGVREALRRLDPVVGVDLGGEQVRWSRALARFGLAGAKHHPTLGPEIRRLMQAMGTQVGRRMFGEDVWVDALGRGVHSGGRVVVADVRFKNELAWVEDAGGMVVRIHRPGVGPANGHASETALDGARFDIEIINDGVPQLMLDRLLAQAERLKAAAP